MEYNLTYNWVYTTTWDDLVSNTIKINYIIK
jgi:hypothetical protein